MNAQSDRLSKSSCVEKPSLHKHVALALLLFVMLQIIIIAKTGGYLCLHLGMIVATGLFAVASRALAKKWTPNRLSAKDKNYNIALNIDLITFWSATVASPFLWIPVAKIVAHL